MPLCGPGPVWRLRLAARRGSGPAPAQGAAGGRATAACREDRVAGGGRSRGCAKWRRRRARLAKQSPLRDGRHPTWDARVANAHGRARRAVPARFPGGRGRRRGGPGLAWGRRGGGVRGRRAGGGECRGRRATVDRGGPGGCPGRRGGRRAGGAPPRLGGPRGPRSVVSSEGRIVLAGALGGSGEPRPRFARVPRSQRANQRRISIRVSASSPPCWPRWWGRPARWWRSSSPRAPTTTPCGTSPTSRGRGRSEPPSTRTS